MWNLQVKRGKGSELVAGKQSGEWGVGKRGGGSEVEGAVHSICSRP